MRVFLIESTTSGLSLGHYNGESPLDAYRSMMADAGYATEEEAMSAGYTLESIPASLSVIEAD